MDVKQMSTEKLKEEKQRLEGKLKGFRGNHIPLDIMEKIGAVLNAKNRDRLTQIKQLAQEVLDSAEPQAEPQSEKQWSDSELAIVISQIIARLNT